MERQHNPNLPEEENTMQICVRIRPITDAERKADGGGRPFNILEGNRVATSDPLKQFPDAEFSFGSVLAGSATSENVYQNSCASLVPIVGSGQSCVCVVVGQSGSGKMYTVVGAGETPGLVRASARDLLREIKALQAAHDDGVFALQLSAFEIHCEHVVDLLRPYVENAQPADEPITHEQVARQLAANQAAVSAAAAAAASSGAASGGGLNSSASSLLRGSVHRRPEVRRLDPVTRGRRGSSGALSSSNSVALLSGSMTARDSAAEERARGFPPPKRSLSNTNLTGGLLSPRDAPAVTLAGPSPSSAALNSSQDGGRAKQLSVSSISLIPELMTPRRIHVHELSDGRITLPTLERARITAPEAAEELVRRAVSHRGVPMSRSSYDRHNAQVVIALTLNQEFGRKDGSLERRSLSSSLYIVVAAALELTTMDSAAFAPEQASAFRVLRATASVFEALSRRNLAYAYFDACLLTRMLRPVLGLHSHTALVGCVHPRTANFTEARATFALLGETHKALQQNKGLDRSDATLREKEASIRNLIKELADAKQALADERAAALETRIQLSQLRREAQTGDIATGGGGGGGAASTYGEHRAELTRADLLRDSRGSAVSLSDDGRASTPGHNIDEGALAALQEERQAMYETLQAHAKQFEHVQTEAKRREAEHNVEVARLKRAVRELEAAQREGEARHTEATAELRARHAAEIAELRQHQDTLLDKEHRLLEASLRDLKPNSVLSPKAVELAQAKERLSTQYKATVRELERTLEAKIGMLEAKVGTLQSELTTKANALSIGNEQHAGYVETTTRQLADLLAFVFKLQTVVGRLERGTYPVHATAVQRLLLVPARRGESVHTQLPALLTLLDSTLETLAEVSEHDGRTGLTPRGTGAGGASGTGASASQHIDLNKNLRIMGDRALRAEIEVLRAHIRTREAAADSSHGAAIRDVVLRDMSAEGTVTHIRRLEAEVENYRQQLAAEQTRSRSLRVAIESQDRALSGLEPSPPSSPPFRSPGSRALSPLVKSSLVYAAQRQPLPSHEPFEVLRTTTASSGRASLRAHRPLTRE